MLITETELFAPPGRGQPQYNPELQYGSKGVNVGSRERVVSALGGLTLIGYGLLRRSIPGAALGLVGGTLVQRGLAGRSRLYSTLGISTAHRGGPGVYVQERIIIQRPRAELYAFWRNLENLPRFMKHVRAVRPVADGRTRWTTMTPGGEIEWTSELTAERQDELIALRTVPGSPLRHSGKVTFQDAPGGRGTVVQVTMEYTLPAGRTAVLLGKLLGVDPEQQVAGDLRRFRQLMETGEIATVEPQPSGRRTWRGKLMSSFIGSVR